MGAAVPIEERMVPGWMRGFEIIVGAIAVVLGFVVLVYPQVAILTLLVWLAFALVVIGIREVSIGLAARWRPMGVRGLGVAAGAVSMFFGFLVIAFPSLGVATLIWLLFFGLLVFGVAEVGIGVGASMLRPGIRGVFVAIGVLNLILAPLILVFPSLARLTLVLLLSIALIVNGIEMGASGVFGRLRAVGVAVVARGGKRSTP